MRSTKPILIVLALLVLLPRAALAVTHDVSIVGLTFRPNNLTIEVGDTVRWTNSGGTHDVSADDGSWRSETSGNWVFSRTFNSIGEVLYHCSVHSGPGQNISTSMNGRINVVQADENQAPTADFSSSCNDLDCTFTDQSSDADGSIASRSWNFGDGGASTATNPTHGYAAAGTYSVMLTVTDDGGASDSQTRMVTVTEPAVEFQINPAITDAWFNPATNGQGFFIIVWEDIGTVFLSWFTYDTERPPQDVEAHLGEPGHRWLTAQGPYQGDMAMLEVNLTAGGVFDSSVPAPDPNVEVGTITIVWTGCNAGLLSYELPALGLAGDIPIERIVLDKVPACEAAQP